MLKPKFVHGVTPESTNSVLHRHQAEGQKVTPFDPPIDPAGDPDGTQDRIVWTWTLG